MKRPGLLFLFMLIFLMSLVVANQAQVINARFTTSAYTWEQRENEETSANHLRAFQLAQITIGRLGARNLSFHTYLYLTGDLLEETTNESHFWLYNCYFDWKNLVKQLDVSVGRQRIYAGVGYGTYDGLQLKYALKNYFNLKLYAGSLVTRSNFDEVDEFDLDNLSWGFHLTSKMLKRTHIGISFARKSRTPVKYATPGLYTGVYRMEHPLTVLQQQLLGFDLSSTIIPKVLVTGRLDYSIRTEQMKRGEFTARYAITPRWDVGFEYIYRHPILYLNSIFSVFPNHSNQEYGMLTQYQWRDYHLTLAFSQVQFEDDQAQRIRFGINWKSYYLGYFHRAGYSGDNDGFSANLSIPVLPELRLILGSSFSSYQMNYEKANKEQALATVLGAFYHPLQTLTLQAQIQVLRNRYFENDLRFFFRGSYAFMHHFDK